VFQNTELEFSIFQHLFKRDYGAQAPPSERGGVLSGDCFIFAGH